MNEPYTTNYGTVIPASTIRTVVREIKAGIDQSDTEYAVLRDAVPAHDDDLAEVTEVYNHCLELADESTES
jgi:hypothetical protein